MSADVIGRRPLGTTGVTMPVLGFGAGPVSGLMTDAAARARQRATIEQALAAGIDWFDTAATYGNGESETSLGAAFRELGAEARVATKVRLAAEQLGGIREAVKTSVASSLDRLGLARVAMVQLHNSITARRGDLPTSVTPRDALEVLAALEELQRDGSVEHCGLTGLGEAGALGEAMGDGAWSTVQVNFSLAEPRTALLEAAQAHGIASLAIRVFAGGALTGQPPSAHTKTTKFFPMAIYERDAQRAVKMEARLPGEMTLAEAALRFAVHHPAVTAALIGFRSPEQVDETVRWTLAGPLEPELVRQLTEP
jgi:aryl-alcohol dehydrogenase-like predicted oxidoreductase